MQPSCLLWQAGVIDYPAGLQLQAQAHRLVEQGAWDGILILLEHHPVITIGTGGRPEQLLCDRRTLAAAGIEVVHSSRGGAITCHNPGQLVGYPVLNLARWQKDVHWYVEQLEELLIRVLQRYGCRGGRKARYTGVWLEECKVAAIGVGVRRWMTSHGFALNVENDLALFQAIIPCGIQAFGVTSLSRQGLALHAADLIPAVAEEFGAVFQCQVSVEEGRR